eukprot:GFUD01033465.1.p1 GENE.GFUD01033465.1~~GFUD01033465.1.p1  ORF type:complete len:1104 (+),score=409.71 GFUD01033465.1:45-3356(+)
MRLTLPQLYRQLTLPTCWLDENTRPAILPPGVGLMPKRKQTKSYPRAVPVRKQVKLSGVCPDLAGAGVCRTGMAPCKVELLDTPNKSSSDKKEYRVIRLENGLTALLIADVAYPLDKLDQEEKDVVEEEMEVEDEENSEDETGDEEDDDDDDEEDDEEDDDEDGPVKRNVLESTGLKMSAAGLCVHMGSFSDPEDMPGLAHFLEHMVFMGSKKFPEENSFESFIAKHGGYDNASTDTETTVFYFESPRRHFHEGLDRFAQFFISPLMKQEAMQREREAVDSEFQMALPSDENRILQIFGGLAKSAHPMAKFMWGNLASLSPQGMSDTDVHSRLHKFRTRHYTAQAMCLTVQSQHSLDTIQDWVVETFAEVPNNGQAREEFSGMKQPFDTPQFTQLYRVIPVQNEYKIDLTWSLPSTLHLYKVKPLHYLAWILGHEGKGSLVSFLRRKVWGLSLTAGNAGDGFEYNSTYSMFPITITLTKEGYDNIDKVVQAVFSYLDMMKDQGPNERIYKEIQKIEDLDFAFSEEKQPSENVENLCENMQFYPPERYLDGDDLMFSYDPEVISELTMALTREKVNIFLRSKEIAADQLDQTEPWFGTPFSCSQIPSSWTDPNHSKEYTDQFHLPQPNVFIAENTSLCPPDPSFISKHPISLLSDTQGELFYKPDMTFLQPRAYIHYLLRSPMQLQSLTNSCLLDLMVMCLMQNIIEDVYPADLAQLHYAIYACESGLVVKVSGLSDKLANLMEVMVQRLVSFKQDTSKEMFQAVLEQQRKNYHNHTIKAKKLVRDVRLELLQDVYHAPHDKHNTVRQLSLEQVTQFAEQFLGQIYIQGLVQGNMTADQAREVDNMLRTKLKCSPLPADCVTDIRCNGLPDGSWTVRADSLDKGDANTLVTNYYQKGPGTIKEHTVMETIVQWMEEPVFDTLRTQEQLGYAVSMTLRNTYGVLGLSVTVNTQATKFTAEHVEQRIENFFKEFIIEHLTEEEIGEAITSLTKLKLRADVTLEEEVCRNWQEIMSKEYVFNRNEREVAVLAEIGLEDVKSLLLPLLSTRKLSVQVVGSDNPDPAQETIAMDTKETVLKFHVGDQLVGQPNTWKEQLVTHPILFITE